MRRRIWIRRILWSLLGLLVFICAGLTFLLTTQWGAEFVMARVGGTMSGSLSYASLQGRIVGPLHLRGLQYKTDAKDVTIHAIDLNWAPLALASGTLHILRLRIQGVDYTALKAAPPSSGALPNINLPLAVKINRLVVRDVTVKQPGQSPIHIKNLSLSGTTDAKGVHFTGVTIDTPWINATLHGTVQPRGKYAIDVKSKWKSNMPGLKAVGGTLNVSGTLSSLHISQHLDAPINGDISVHVTNAMTDPRWSGHVVVRHMRTAALGLNLPADNIQADVKAAGGLHHFSTQGRTTVSVKAVPQPLTIKFDLTYAGSVLDITSMEVTAAHAPTRIYMTGQVTVGQPRTVNLTATWRRLIWPMAPQGPYTVSSDHGTVHLKGPLDNYHLSLAAPFHGAHLPDSQWRAVAHGGKHSMTLTEVTIHTLHGTVGGHGTLGWSPAIDWDLHLSGAGLNPGVQWSSYPGKLAFTAATSGTFAAAGTTVTLQVPQASGQLRGNRFSADAALSYTDKLVRIDHVHVASGKNHVSASGTAGKRWDMHWSLNAPDLGAIMPDAGGALASTGRITGPLHQPKVKADLHGHGIGYRGYRLDRLEANAAVDLQQGHRSQVQVKVTGLKAKGRSIDSVSLTGTGTLAEQHLQLTMHTGGADLDMRVAGGYQGGEWQGTLRRLALTGAPRLGDWHLEKAVPMTAARDHFQMQELCWVRSPARLCARARWRRGGPWDAHVQAHRLRLAWMQSLVSSQLTLSGSMEASLNAAHRSSGLTLQGDMDVSGSSAAAKLPDGSLATVKIITGHFTAATRGGKVHSDLIVRLANGDNLKGTFVVPVPSVNAMGTRPALSLSGTATARWTRFDLLPHFMTTVSHPTGVLTAKLDFGGTLSQPTVAGHMDIAKASVDVPVYGLKLTHLKVHAASTDGKTFEMYGSVESGGGTAKFSANGRLPFGGGPETVELTLTTDNFQAVKIPEAQARITADVSVRMTATAIDFTGNVFIPEAKIKPPDLSSTVKTSSDVVIVKGRKLAAPAAGRALNGIIEVRFGDKVQFEGYGLKAKITGDIAVQEQPKRPILAYGSLNITGVFKAYGQNLTITQGRIMYVGSSIDNPGIGIRAQRTVGDITAGIVATGTVQHPKFTVFSNPTMDQTDALSYLLLGHPVNQASTSQGKQLASAALSLGLTGGEFIAKKIGRMFGLEQVEVGTNPTTGNPALILGTYLRPDLFLSYGFDIMQHINILRVRYQMTKQWALDAQSGLYTSADILYTIETH